MITEVVENAIDWLSNLARGSQEEIYVHRKFTKRSCLRPFYTIMWSMSKCLWPTTTWFTWIHGSDFIAVILIQVKARSSLSCESTAFQTMLDFLVGINYWMELHWLCCSLFFKQFIKTHFKGCYFMQIAEYDKVKTKLVVEKLFTFNVNALHTLNIIGWHI